MDHGMVYHGLWMEKREWHHLLMQKKLSKNLKVKSLPLMKKSIELKRDKDNMFEGSMLLFIEVSIIMQFINFHYVLAL